MADAYRIGAEVTQGIIVTTGNEVDGYRIAEYLGIVRGLVVRSPSFGQGSLKSLGGGNIAEFALVCEQARHDAYLQMHEYLAYGTAVRLVAKT